MKIVLVRHGRPDEEDAARPHDPPLRAEGWSQARAAARALAAEGITRIVASPLQRAQQTATPLAEQLGLPVHTIEGWAEADRHAPRYRSTETLRAMGDEQWQAFLANPIGFFGGDEAQFRAGVLAALEQVLREGGERDHVAVFTHGLPINVVLSGVLALPSIVRFQPGYGSITRLRARDKLAVDVSGLSIISVNESGHHGPAQEQTS
jgi:broad specificity phosphatase PhoE